MTAQQRNAHKRLAKALCCTIYKPLNFNAETVGQLSGNTLNKLCERIQQRMSNVAVSIKDLSATLDEDRDVISAGIVKLLKDKKIINISKKGRPGMYINAKSSWEM